MISREALCCLAVLSFGLKFLRFDAACKALVYKKLLTTDSGYLFYWLHHLSFAA